MVVSCGGVALRDRHKQSDIATAYLRPPVKPASSPFAVRLIDGRLTKVSSEKGRKIFIRKTTVLSVGSHPDAVIPGLLVFLFVPAISMLGLFCFVLFLLSFCFIVD